MQIVDTQVHLNRDIGVEASLMAMDAVGIDAVLIDELSGMDARGYWKPYRMLPNGVARPEYPLALEAVRRYPGRFAYLGRVDPADPELDDVIKDVAANPHQLCLRVAPQPPLGEVAAFEAGAYDELLKSAQDNGVPVMLWLAGNLHLLDRVARDYPGLSIILNHCGMLPLAPGAEIDRNFLFRDVATAARFDNVSVQLSHAPRLSQQLYPFTDVALGVRQLIDVFGEHRVMWASDILNVRGHHTWAEAVHYLRDCDVLSTTEKEWIFAKTAFSILPWPQNKTFGLYRAP